MRVVVAAKFQEMRITTYVRSSRFHSYVYVSAYDHYAFYLFVFVSIFWLYYINAITFGLLGTICSFFLAQFFTL